MTIQPIKSTPAPGYPDKTRWLAAPLAVGLTAAMALGLSACGERAAVGDVAQVTTEITATQAAAANAAQTPATTGAGETDPTGATQRAARAEPKNNAVPTTTEYVVMGDFPVPVTDYYTLGVPVLVPDAE